METQKQEKTAETSAEIMPSINADLENLEQALATAERVEERVRKIKAMALRQTNKMDWVDMGGKPYLQASGAEKIARLFGISWRICAEYPKKEFITDEKGSYYIYIFKGEFMMGGKAIEVVGTCGQKDKFLGHSKGALKEASEIDEGAVIKKANTNMVARGITTILGIRNLTWEEITGATGAKKEESSGVSYKGGSKGGGLKEIVGEIVKAELKEGEKNGKKWRRWTLSIDTGGKRLIVSTFDDKKYYEGAAVKAVDITTNEYKGQVYYQAAKVDFLDFDSGGEADENGVIEGGQNE